MGKAIALATPVFFLLIGLEWLVARWRGTQAVYRLNDTINSLSLGVLSQVVNLFMRVLAIGVYILVFEHVALGKWPQDQWWAWALAIVFYDFCYYWNHRLGHESAVFWASHVVHHQSQCYNLSTALRQSSSGNVLSWVFYLPMAIAGVPPAMFAVAAVVDLLYQYWIHTELIGKLGWFDRWFASPSNHRVHHAVNDQYVDRNYGGIFMVWDRLFGTFVPETERCVYGTRAPLNSWDPLWANLEIYADLARKSARQRRWANKVRLWLKPPGWQPVGPDGKAWAPAHFPTETLVTYDPPATTAARWFATSQIVLAIGAALPLLWYADTLRQPLLLVWAGSIVVVLWLAGAVLQSRVPVRRGIALQVGMIALAFAAVTASAGSTAPIIRDDAKVQRAVEHARTAFMAGQTFDRMQVSVLVRDRAGRWRHGAVDGTTPAYPASSVKLAFLVAAVHWCAEHNQPPPCLDEYVRPMIEVSDNVATGFVVDRISGAPNADEGTQDLDAWIEKRRYTERVIEAAGLLGSQRLFTKTYPTNSGEEPAGLERVAWQRLGRNAMTANLAAELMLGVVSGTLEPQATDYMRSLLRRPTFSAYSSLGGGLPPGSLHENKIGSAFDTLQDVMHAQLPGGQQLIIAVLSNAWESSEPEPGDVAKLGGFTARLLDELRLVPKGSRPRFFAATSSDDDAVRWQVRLPARGRYEVAIKYPADVANTKRASVTLDGQLAAPDLDQTVWSNRWIKLGDYDLANGTAQFEMRRGDSGHLAPGKLRVTRWPD